PGGFLFAAGPSVDTDRLRVYDSCRFESPGRPPGIEERMSETTTERPERRGTLWLILIVAWLGWMFDGMEMGIYSVLAHPALKELLNTTDKGVITQYACHMFAL